MSSRDELISIVLAGGEGKRLLPLTHDRAKPAVPFGGAYRWKLILNTDELRFGGSGVAPTDIQTFYEEYKGLPTHSVLAIPPLATIWLTPEG